ncbi:DUF5615 family PIN-like protein [Methylopila sp. M107]|uniref:DUF5615 family PIN-like protein n=1 Tax=Methylopila sp. M107 TaxID=1101190 RepID=UPI000364B7E1|nr:DUF5615 family PIN-like protein [Methylopila sp. M107]
MRLLADECLPSDFVDALARKGHDVAYAASDAPGDVDLDVLARSVRERRVLVTADRGFGELVIRERRDGFAIVVIITARENNDLRSMAETITERIGELGEDALFGRLTIMTASGTRQRDLPGREP